MINEEIEAPASGRQKNCKLDPMTSVPRLGNCVRLRQASTTISFRKTKRGGPPQFVILTHVKFMNFSLNLLHGMSDASAEIKGCEMKIENKKNNELKIFSPDRTRSHTCGGPQVPFSFARPFFWIVLSLFLFANFNKRLHAVMQRQRNVSRKRDNVILC